MRKHLKFLCRAIVVALVIGVCANYAWNVMRLKSLSGLGIQSRTYTNFYNLPRNSVDVLIIGSSDIRESVIPQQLYNDYGIVSYNLASSAQSILVSYYWLKEALKTQSPKAVIMETQCFFKDPWIQPSNNRPAVDEMRWGLNKLGFVCDFGKYNPSEDTKSHFLINLRYHDRWKRLKQEDFIVNDIIPEFDLKGYSGGYQKTNNLKFKAFQVTGSNKMGKFHETTLYYIENIISLCKSHGIKLILVKTPHAAHTIELHNALKGLAVQNELPFYDMNEESLFAQTGIDFNTDFADQAHVNYYGALKVTDFIGKTLVNDIGIQPRKAEEWEATKADYEEFKADYRLPLTTNVTDYLSILTANKDHYTILISARDDASKFLGTNAQAVLKNLGLKNNWEKNAYRKSYIAVIENGKVLYENMSDKKLSHKCAFDKKRFICETESAGNNCGNRSSIKIDGAERSKNKRGLNIVVFSNNRHLVIDSVCFDTNAKDNKCYR